MVPPLEEMVLDLKLDTEVRVRVWMRMWMVMGCLTHKTQIGNGAFKVSALIAFQGCCTVRPVSYPCQEPFLSVYLSDRCG